MPVVEQPRQALVDDFEVLLVLEAVQHQVSEHVVATVAGGRRVFPHRRLLIATILRVVAEVLGFSVRVRDRVKICFGLQYRFGGEEVISKHRLLWS